VQSGRPRTRPGELAVARLSANNWDDFGLRTLFDVRLYLPTGETAVLGEVKIFRRGQDEGATALPAEFTGLPADYVSVGQDPGYYEMLGAWPDVREELLRGLRDATLLSSAELAGLEDERAWRRSLLRFGQAEAALQAQLRTTGREDRAAGVLSFDFNINGRRGGPVVSFRFDDRGELPGRVHALVGYNGVGKTQLLADLAAAASRVYGPSPQDGPSPRTVDRLSGADTVFGAVVAVSYSAFDDFARPPSRPDRQAVGETNFFGYTYCGLRRADPGTVAPEGDEEPAAARAKQPDRAEQPEREVAAVVDRRPPVETRELKSLDELTAEFLHAFGQANGDDGRRLPLLAALQRLAAEPSFGRIGIDPAELVDLPKPTIRSRFAASSTGHKVVLNIVAQLAANLHQRSLVLLDEPEAHLHPPLVAALLQALHQLLEAHDSFAVVATHSPVVLQETPAAQVHVLSRYGQHTTISDVTIETFAEGIGAITRSVFHLDSSATDYQGALQLLAQRHSLEEIDALFAHGLSAQGRALVLRYQRSARLSD